MITDITGDRHSRTAPVADDRPGHEQVRQQASRILGSETFRASDALRRLLKFLVNKTLSGEAEYLKEYTIGLDVLGKPASYDPGKDAVVRLQASRLRQKLNEYYRGEGINDAVVIELPKGGFRVTWHANAGDPARPVSPPSLSAATPERPDVDLSETRRWRLIAFGFAAASMVLACLAAWAALRTPETIAAGTSSTPRSPELDALWRPFLSPTHHLIIAFGNPLFVRLQRPGNPDIVYRTRGNMTWDDAIHSPEYSVLTRSLGNTTAIPSFHLVERSCLFSTFVLSQFFARRIGDVSLARSADLSWQEFADNDVILLAPLRLGDGKPALPVKQALVVDKFGVRNLTPRAGEPSLYTDPPGHQESDGEGLELISMLPGPLGRTTVVTFASNHAWGLLGGVRALTDPAFARVLTKRLKDSAGNLPAYYQIVLRISYRDGTPTNASYVTHRILTITHDAGQGPAN